MSNKELVTIAAALGIDAKKVNTDKLVLEILAGIDSLENRVECVQKEVIKSHRKKSYWRTIAKNCLHREE